MRQQQKTPQGGADDFQIGAGWVLASVAYRYSTERPEDVVDKLGLPVNVAAQAYRLMGAAYRGGMPAVARVAMDAAPVIPDDMPRGTAAVLLAESARALGFEWPDDSDEPVIPRIPIPRPRPSSDGGKGARGSAVRCG